MPELPEVETTLRGISPHILQRPITKVTVRNAQLRWPIDRQLNRKLQHRVILDVTRRGKYLLLAFEHGTLLWHLGMSGNLRIVSSTTPVMKHDHVDIAFDNNKVLRFNDPRRFGAVVWTKEPVDEHALISHLGPEPLSDAFTAEYLYQRSRKRKQAIKMWLMDSKVVVGVGNIYANEALFNAKIHPLKAAEKLTKAKSIVLVEEVRKVLHNAITRGGTTLRDFVGGDGKPGYFAQELNVYGRGGEACVNCGKVLLEKRLGQRTTVYCSQCQG